jgi:hypothetical protein
MEALVAVWAAKVREQEVESAESAESADRGEEVAVRASVHDTDVARKEAVRREQEMRAERELGMSWQWEPVNQHASCGSCRGCRPCGGGVPVRPVCKTNAVWAGWLVPTPETQRRAPSLRSVWRVFAWTDTCRTPLLSYYASTEEFGNVQLAMVSVPPESGNVVYLQGFGDLTFVFLV